MALSPAYNAQQAKTKTINIKEVQEDTIAHQQQSKQHILYKAYTIVSALNTLEINETGNTTHTQ